MDSEAENVSAPPGSGAAIYFDGKSSRRRLVTLAFSDRLELREAADHRRTATQSLSQQAWCFPVGNNALLRKSHDLDVNHSPEALASSQ